MKRLKKVFLLLLCVSLVLSAVSIFSLAETELTEYGYYSVDKWYMDYPICRRFYNTFNHDGDFHYWYMSDYRNWQHNDTLLNFMSSLWLKYYCVGDPEVICDDYINKFEVDLVNAYSDRPPYTSSSGTQLYGFAVDNYSWENNTLTACCTMDYDITERRYFDDEYGMYYSETVGNLNAYVCLGFTNKSDGKLVNLAKIEDFVIAPEYEYHDSLIGKYHYTYSFSDTFTVEMPSFYDPLKHDVTLYFYAFDTEYYWDSLPLGDGFYNPTPLTRDDIVEPEPPVVDPPEADPTLPKIQPWETYDEDDMFYPEMTVSNSGILWTWGGFKKLYNNISSYGYHQCSFTTSATSNLQWIDASDEYYINTSNVKLTDDNKLMFDYTASIELNSTEGGRNRNHSFLALFYFEAGDTSKPGSFLSGEKDVDGFQIIRYVSPGRANGKVIIESGKNVTVELPSNFDPEKHMIACAVWSIENEPVEYPESNWSSLESPAVLSTPLSVFDLTEYLPEPEPPVVEPPTPEVVRGDADGDGVLNLADVTATMKYLAEWKDVVIDEAAADTDGNGSVNLTDVSFMLQLIAGWNV